MKTSAIQRYLLLALITLCLPLTSVAKDQNQLVILNWGEYLDPDLVQKFEQQFKAHVHQILYDSDEDRDVILLESQGSGYDLIVTSGVALDGYAKRGWLAPLDHDKAPNLKHLSDRWQDAFPASHEYGMPYFWGTLGIVYRADLVKQPITSWQQLYKPDESLRGRIVMMDDSREVVSMGLKALGYSANSEDSTAYKKVSELLRAQKPYVKSYCYVSIRPTSPLISGDVVAAMAYSGDALVVAEHHKDIVYVLPQEGGNIWVDYFVLAKKAKNSAMAYAFLNFINEPKNAAQQAEYVYCATPNMAAEEFLSKEFMQDSTIYPPEQNLKNSEFYKQVSPRTTRSRNNISAIILH